MALTRSRLVIATSLGPVHYTDYDTRVAAYALILDRAEGVDRILLAWWNGEGRGTPGWSLPGGGVELTEQLEEALVRELREETGYDVVVGRPLVTHSYAGAPSVATGRPFRAVRVVFDATVVGGTLGTLEVGGSTDHAAWMPLSELARHETRTGIVDVAVSAHLARTGERTRNRQTALPQAPPPGAR